jgi:hypothetical protein
MVPSASLDPVPSTLTVRPAFATVKAAVGAWLAGGGGTVTLCVVVVDRPPLSVTFRLMV